jgi:hypothetical protein
MGTVERVHTRVLWQKPRWHRWKQSGRGTAPCVQQPALGLVLIEFSRPFRDLGVMIE